MPISKQCALLAYTHKIYQNKNHNLIRKHTFIKKKIGASVLEGSLTILDNKIYNNKQAGL